MFCNHCPDIITQYLTNYGDAVVINDPISLDHPVIKFTYVPLQTLKRGKFCLI